MLPNRFRFPYYRPSYYSPYPRTQPNYTDTYPNIYPNSYPTPYNNTCTNQYTKPHSNPYNNQSCKNNTSRQPPHEQYEQKYNYQNKETSENKTPSQSEPKAKPREDRHSNSSFNQIPILNNILGFLPTSLGPLNFHPDALNDNNLPIFEMFGIELFLDDIIIICILIFLYKEEVKDQMLYISLILLLFS